MTNEHEALIDRLESYYDFECTGGPLKNCREWQELKALLPTDGNDKFDEVTWAELVRLREETRWHVELRITTRCPSCGHQSLFIGKGGHLTCSWLECKEPGLERAIEKLASAPSAPQPSDQLVTSGDQAQEEPTQANSTGLIAKWRAEAERLRSAADEVRRRGTGSRQAIGAQAAHSFSAATLEACANDLEALSSSVPASDPNERVELSPSTVMAYRRRVTPVKATTRLATDEEAAAPVERPQRPPSEETQFWAVTVSRNGDDLVTIETNCLSGKPEFSEEDARVIRMAAEHLSAFIGPEEREPFIPCDHDYVWVQKTVLNGTQYRCDICGHVKWEKAPAETQEDRPVVWKEIEEPRTGEPLFIPTQPSPETPATRRIEMIEEVSPEGERRCVESPNQDKEGR